MGFAQTKLSYRYGYISETLEALNIEPGTFCEQFNEKMTQKVNHDKARKSTVVSKRRRAQMPSRTVAKVMDYTIRVIWTTRKEAEEGNIPNFSWFGQFGLSQCKY